MILDGAAIKFRPVTGDAWQDLPATSCPIEWWPDQMEVPDSECGIAPPPGSYTVISESCMPETHYNLPTLDEQAASQCPMYPVGETVEIHHFPQFEIGCYTTVRCN